MAKSLFETIVDRSITILNEDDLKGVTQIGKNAFSNCLSLTNITLPNNVTSIGFGVFSGCTSLINATLPNSITSISGSAFNGCTSLETITIESSVSSIEKSAFGNASGAMKISNAYFKQPSGMAVTLPTAGGGTGMFYVKTARNMNVYTDNETIKNYDYASDNITPTFYHLDGTAW